MRFRNWLLTGTSLTLLALAPVTVARAQDASDPALVAAYQAYRASQDDASKQALTEACIAAGFQSLDDCIAALSKTKPVQEEKPAPAPSQEEAAPPPASEQAAPAPAPSQEAAPAPASSEEAAPAPAPQEAAPPASSEQPKPKKPKKPAVVSSSEEAAPVAPSSEDVAPAAPSSEEAAPAPAPAPSSEEAAPPASSEQAAPASSEQPPADGAPKKLIAAVDAYNAAVAELDAGDTAARAKVDKAKAQIDKLCAAGGFADTDACLAQFGLALNPLPPQTGEPSSEVTAPSSEEAAPSSEAPISELPNASEAVTPSAVEVLPPTVAPSEAAPILDSAKDDQTQADQGQPAAPDQTSSSQPPAPTTPPAPPPTDDKQAQADITPPPADQQSTQTDTGKKIDVEQIQVRPPKDSDRPIKVIEQPKPPKDNGNGKPPKDNGVIFQIGVNIVINNPEQERDRFYDPRQDQIYYEDIGRGRTRETIERRDGTKIVTVRNRNGDILQRSKILKNGREIILATYDPRDRDIDSWRDPGDDLPPLRLTIPADQYILDADSADEDEVSSFLEQPPVEQVRRIYTIDEVKRSARLRDSVRRLEVGGLTFDTGKATISRDQVGALGKVAKAMQTALDRNPGEVFLIEGHTDAVGSDISNLVLSDQRAATVARILTDFYDIPPENLVTQGYGERYLKVKTDGPEPLNRRVTIKRITSLISYASAN